jgi:ribokinase
MTLRRRSRPRGVVVLGGLNMDLVVETPRPAGPGETREGTRFYATPGGKGGNQAVAAARILGERTAVVMVGRVGRESYGDDLIASMNGAGVDTRYVRRDPTATTGVAVIFIDAQGESYVNAVYGANARCDRQQVADAREALVDASVLLVQQEIPVDVTFEAMKDARRAGATVILDPSPTRFPLPEGYLTACDIVTPNEHEAADLCGFAVDGVDSARRAALQIRDAGAATVIITLGEAGAWVESDSVSELIPAPSVRAVATVGAGDAFNGGLAAGLATGLDLMQAVRLGVAAGALCVTREGAQQAMPARAEVERLLRGEG